MSTPIKNYKFGGVECAVWENDNKFNPGQKTYSFSFQKSFKTKSGDWKQTGFFSDKDLLILSKLASFVFSKKIQVYDQNTPKKQATAPQAPNNSGVHNKMDKDLDSAFEGRIDDDPFSPGNTQF